MRTTKIAALLSCVMVVPLLSASALSSWEERSILALVNRARVDPAAALAGCTQCSPAESSGCYAAASPLTFNASLAESARFHSESRYRQGFTGRDTPCALRADLDSVYPDACDASAECSCIGTGSTSWTDRITRFGATATAEIMFTGSDAPFDIFGGWLHEPAPSAPCGLVAENENRWTILKTDAPAAGAGVFSFPDPAPATLDFGSGTSPGAQKLASGSHWTPDGQRQGPTVEFWANWFDVAPPTEANVVIDGVAFPLSLARGTPYNGAWNTSSTQLSVGCHRYYFTFTDASAAAHALPPSGSWGVGTGSCADWIPSRTARGVDGDLDGDGRADLILRNFAANPNVAYWLLAGSSVIDGGFVPSVTDQWKLVGTGDFTGDRQTDIMWNDATCHPGGCGGSGWLTVWTMNGVAYWSQDTLSFLRWDTIRAVADFDGDGDADYIGRNRVTGTNAVWLMNGMEPVEFAMAPPVENLDWTIAGGADVTGDGKGDVVWWNGVTGDVALWVMNGLSRASNIYVGRVAEVSWKVAAVGDFNGDDHADLAWQHTNGDIAVWFLDANGTPFDGAYVGNAGAWWIAGPK